MTAPIRRWGSPHVSQEERNRFLREVLFPGNLRRIFWLIVVCLPISLFFFVNNRLNLQADAIDPWNVFELTLSGLFLVLTVAARKKPGSLRWVYGFIVIYYVYCLVSMDGYYFASFNRFGENTEYVMGIMMAAVLIWIPPRVFFTILLTNHAVYLTLVLSSGRSAESELSACISGTNGLVVACLAAWFLFAREWKNFQRGELILKGNRDLAEANARLYQNNEEINEIMAIAAHDLRSPLHGLKNLFELQLKQGEWQRESYSRTLTFATEGICQILGQLDHMLKAHEAEHQIGDLAFESADLRVSFADGVERMRRMAERKQILLDTSLPSVSVVASFSPPAVARVLDNLLSNAIKFAPHGSTVLVLLREEGAFWRGEVQDEGPGVSRCDQEKLFLKFQGGFNLPTSGESSSGLGLFISLKLMRMMGGSLEYQAREPRGSAFVLRFPREENARLIT